MSAPGPSTALATPTGPSLRVRIAAIAVLVALAALAAYTVFSGPTRVSISGSHGASPTVSPLTPASQSAKVREGEVTEPDPANYPWWLASRSAGIVAFVLIASAVILGLVLASRFLPWPPG